MADRLPNPSANAEPSSIISGQKAAGECLGLTQERVRQLRRTDPHFPASLDPDAKPAEWYACQLGAYALLRQARQARADMRRTVTQRFEEHGIQPAGPREGLRRFPRPSMMDASRGSYLLYDFKTEDGVYALECGPLPPSGSPLGRWRLTLWGVTDSFKRFGTLAWWPPSSQRGH